MVSCEWFFVLNCDSFDFMIGMIDSLTIIVHHSIMEIRAQDDSAITVSNTLLILVPDAVRLLLHSESGR